MGRIHGRNGVLYLKDKDGKEKRIVITDWTMTFNPGSGHLGPRLEVREAPADSVKNALMEDE